jgi:ubiquinone/menaquinone biosynthesis C-methylase UbiE
VRLALTSLGLAGLFAALVPGCKRAEADRPARAMSSADYDLWRQPDAVVAALELRPGDAVVDLGAGRGYLTGRLARAVGPSGRVVATDIDAGALAAVKSIARTPDMAPIETRAVTADEPGLEAGAYDLILLAEVDHYLPDRVAYLGRLRSVLAAGGRLAVENRLHHRKGLVADAARAGYRVIDRPAPPGQFLVILEPIP